MGRGVWTGLVVVVAAIAVASVASAAPKLGISVRSARGQVVIVKVEPDSVAEASGLEAGWAIRAIDGEPVRNRADLGRILRARPAGETLTFRVGRRDRTEDVVVDFDDGQNRPPAEPPVPPEPARLPEPLATPDAPKSVFIMPFRDSDVEGKSSDWAEQVLEGVATELSGRPEFRVVTRGDVEALIARQQAKTAIDCEEDTECMAQIFERTEAELLLSGSVGQVGRERVLTMTLSDAETSESIGRIGGSAETRSGLFDRIPELVAELFRYAAASKLAFTLPDRANISFAVFDIESTGVDEDTVRNLTQFLTVELSKIRGARVISPDDISTILGKEQMDQMLGGECDQECMIDLSGALNVNYIVVGQVGRLDREFVLALRLIDPREVEVANRITETVRGPKEELTRAMRTLARRLVGVDTDLDGRLVITGPMSGGEVFIGGRPFGSLPAQPDQVFPPQRTKVRVVRDGFFDWESDVFVQPGEESVVWAELERRPDPLTKKWWFWTLIGGAVAGGVTTGVVLSQSDSDAGSGSVVLD
jgi:TolB-like protein